MPLLQSIQILMLGASLVMAASVDPKKDIEIPNTCSVIACGNPGSNGLPGRDGRDGKEGPKGEKGDQGLQGLRGLQGPPGKAGPPGTAGSAGLRGQKGDSGGSELDLLKRQITALDLQLKTVQAVSAKLRKALLLQSARAVGEKLFVTNNQEAAYQAAKVVCAKVGGLLASPRNAAENIAILEIVAMTGKAAYLGMDDIQTEGTFKHLNGEKIIYTNWSPKEPNNEKGIEDCVEMFSHGMWNDKSCGEKRLVVCEL